MHTLARDTPPHETSFWGQPPVYGSGAEQTLFAVAPDDTLDSDLLQSFPSLNRVIWLMMVTSDTIINNGSILVAAYWLVRRS
jgi:hypothetical protein